MKLIKIKLVKTLPSLSEKFTRQYLSEINQQEQEVFETALRIRAIPPIKGKITRGKLRWRGIKIVKQHTTTHYSSWLEQRGVQISDKFCIRKFGS